MDHRDDLVVSDRLVVPATELTWRFSPSGGPGGQHANTSNTRAEVVFDIAGSGILTESQRERLVGRYGAKLSVSVDDTRSQTRNRQLALDRLATKLRDGLVTAKSRRATKPGRGARERRLKDKKQRAQLKQSRRRSYDD